ncbi:MAG: DUF2807 domain-containing protein [Bacteroidetes bacterium]|nr:DUF2807 domain-containing protein [Bacteroidota bacterium]
MRRKIEIIICGMALLFATTSCNDSLNCEPGLGPIISVEIPLDSFDGISLDVAGNVFITQDTIQRVIVESNENIIGGLSTQVNDGLWDIRFRNCFNHYDKFDVYISVPNLNRVILSGSGNISGEGTFQAEQFDVFILGAGNISLMVEANSVDLEISGSGNISIAGNTNQLSAVISGSGNILAIDLETKTCTVSIPGSGNCDVYVTEELNVVISGSGSVRYKGEPPIVQTQISGSGTVTPIN